jgi:hypothetical protein
MASKQAKGSGLALSANAPKFRIQQPDSGPNVMKLDDLRT